MAATTPEPLACAVVEIDSLGCIRRANPLWAELMGGGAEQMPGSRITEWFPQERSVLEGLERAAQTGVPIRLQARRADLVPMIVTVEARAATERGTGLTCVIRALAGQELLHESQLYLDAAFELAPIGMAVFDTSGRYVRVNDALCRLLGCSREELIGRRDQEFTHPEDRQSDVDAAWRILAGELDIWQTEKRFVRPTGEVVWAIANLVFLRDPEGRPLSWLGQFQDITERKHTEELLRHLAVHDELTGVANRRGLNQEMSHRLAEARRHDESGAVLLLDLDGFKEINDRYGHQTGDDLLAQASSALRERLRETDFLARLGGDEFAVILPRVDEAAAYRVAQQLLDALQELGPAGMSGSCGVALYHRGSPAAPAILASADHAMYRAKAGGHGRVVVAAADAAHA